MRKRFALSVFVFFVLARVSAQIPDPMPIVVNKDDIQIGKERVPRCISLPKVLAVPAGQSVTADADSTWDCVEVSGTLRFDRTRNTTLRTTHLFVLPGSGKLDISTVADPMPANVKVEVVVRDVTIDLARDPFQWGNGILNFGRMDAVGAKKLEWTTLTAEVKAGATTLDLAADPIGWLAGDELLVPDTAQAAPRREPPIVVTGISGRRVTIARGLAFDHNAIRKPDGAVVLLPRVANLTRNINIRSENPDGTRGHTAHVGHGAMWDIEYVAFSGLGRTRAETLNNTVASSEPPHIGTNQVGRYTDHKHHAMGFGSVSRGNVYRGSAPKGGKWGLADHGVHDSVIEANIALDFTGAGFTTEDGYEVRNVFRRNFSAYNLQPNPLFTGGDASLTNVITRNAPGSEGNGFWFRGVQNFIEDNEAWNNGIGINEFNFQQVAGAYPSQPGGMLDTALVQAKMKPLSFTRNVTAGNFTGVELWGFGEFPHDNHISAYNTHAQIFGSNSEPTQAYFRNLKAIGQAGKSFCFESSNGYVETLKMENSELLGCFVGISDGGAIRSVRLQSVTLQNALDLDYRRPAREIEHIDVMHVPLPGFPPQFIELGLQSVWPGPPTPLPDPILTWVFQRAGRSFIIRNWQGTGQTYRMFEPQQLASTAAWPSGPGAQLYNSPEAGLSMKTSYEKYGMAWGGEALNDADAIRLPGVIGLARVGPNKVYQPPRCVVTYPNSRTPAEVKRDDSGNNYIMLFGLLTGDPNQALAEEGCAFDIDGGAALRMVHNDDFKPDEYRQSTRVVAEGTHTIRTWRTLAGVKLPASELTFKYFTGPTPPPIDPPPPPPPKPPVAPVVTAPLVAGGTSVSGTGLAGAFAKVLVNGVGAGAGAVVGAGGAFVVTVPALTQGASVAATQTVNGLTSPPSPAVIVSPAPPPPPTWVQVGTFSITGTTQRGIVQRLGTEKRFRNCVITGVVGAPTCFAEFTVP